MFNSKYLKVSVGLFISSIFIFFVSGHTSAKTMMLQAPQVQCESGFSKTAQVKGENGMTMKMVCKTPVITCPENAQKGITSALEPKIKNLGKADGIQKFRFVYTCKYYEVVG